MARVGRTVVGGGGSGGGDCGARRRVRVCMCERRGSLKARLQRAEKYALGTLPCRHSQDPPATGPLGLQAGPGRIYLFCLFIQHQDPRTPPDAKPTASSTATKAVACSRPLFVQIKHRTHATGGDEGPAAHK